MDSKLMQYIPQDDIYLFNTGNAQKAWLSFGCRYIPEIGLHRFLVWAPNAQAVSLVGDFNGWDRSATPMERVEGGVWPRWSTTNTTTGRTKTIWPAAPIGISCTAR